MTFTDQPSMITECETYMNGRMKLGLGNLMQSVFFYQLNQLVLFDGMNGANKTMQFLSGFEQDPLLQQYLKLSLRYGYDATDLVR
jgi:hypothetical protein